MVKKLHGPGSTMSLTPSVHPMREVMDVHSADEVVKLDAPQICVQLASLGGSYEPHCFATQFTENAHVSHAAMAFGSVSKDDNACEIFEARVLEMLATAFATI